MLAKAMFPGRSSSDLFGIEFADMLSTARSFIPDRLASDLA